MTNNERIQANNAELGVSEDYPEITGGDTIWQLY
jgi:hypothetical protein